MGRFAEHDAASCARIGAPGFAALVAAFYEGVRADALLAPMYPGGDFEGAEHRLREFLLFRFGLEQSYLAERGHPRLRMRHAPFPIGSAARDRWLELMDAALEHAVDDASARDALRAFFDDVAHFLQNRQP